MAKYITQVFIFFLLISLNFSNGIILDKVQDIDEFTWTTEYCNSVRNNFDDIACAPQGLLPYENEGFFTSCFLDTVNCTIKYQNSNGFIPSSISITGAIWGSGAKITVSTKYSPNFFEIDYTSEKWESFEKDIPVQDIEPDMELFIRLEGMFYDNPFAIIDSINVKEREFETTTVVMTKETTTEKSSTATYDTTTYSTTYDYPESTSHRSTYNQESTPYSTTYDYPESTSHRSTYNQDSTPYSTTYDYPESTSHRSTYNQESTPYPTTYDYPESTSHRSTYNQESTPYPTTYDYPESTTDGHDGQICKPKTWTTSTTWTDVTQSSNCSYMIEIVTKTLVTTTTLQYIN